MAKRSPRIPELRQKNELSCMWGLLSILESCQGCTSDELIADGRPVKKQVIDYPRKLAQLASFDEECRKIQKCTDRLMITEKGRKNSHKAYQSTSSRLHNATSLINQMSSTAEMSLDKLTVAEILGTVCDQNQQEESTVHECFQTSRNYDQVDKTIMQQVQMSSKAFTDQMFIGRKSFSDALEALNLNKDPFVELLSDSKSLAARGTKNLHPSQTAKEMLKPVVVAELSECESQEASCFRKPGSTFNTDKIVILKPVPDDTKYSDKVTCHCSSLQSNKRLSRKVSDAKHTSFSSREMKKKFKHTLAGTRRGHSQFSMDGTSERGNNCIYHEVDSFNSSTMAKRKEKLRKNQYHKSDGESDIACATDTVRKKLDVSGARFSQKHEQDVILEGKRHLSTRLKYLNGVESLRSQKSPRTLRRILSSPEHDFSPLSPRWDKQYFSGSPEVRFRPYNTSSRVGEDTSQIPHGLSFLFSPLRPTIEVSNQILNREESVVIISNDGQAHDSIISATDNERSRGEPMIVEMNGILHPESCNAEEWSEINSTDVTRIMQITDAIGPHEEAESVKSSTVDSVSENEAAESKEDDFSSTPSSIYRSDTTNSSKCQEEHQSPVSVLEPLFIEDANYPLSTTLQTAGQRLQPRRLDFEKCSFESFREDLRFSANSCMGEQYQISRYVHLVLQNSCLSWDHLSEMRLLPEELLPASLFEEVEFLPAVSQFDPKLLFDRINEVIQDIYIFHFCTSPWLAFLKPRIRSVPMEQIVLDEIMTEAECYLLPLTEKRTLDQLISKAMADSRSWLDIRLHTEKIVTDISEDMLEDFILDVLLEFHV